MVQKHKHVHLQEWLEIVYWRQQGFFTLKLTHRKVSNDNNEKNKTKRKKKQNRTGGPYTAEGYAA